MDELGKLKRVVQRQLPGAPHESLLVLDAPTGQNGFAQARMFHEAIGLTGVVLTKLDGTAKGGIVVRIVRELKLPVKLIGVGEKIDDLQPFDPVRFVDALVPDVSDAAFMRHALGLAERGRGLTSPNPMVGAVVVREGRVVGEGAHLRAGGDHAEVEALAAAGDGRARRHAVRDAGAVRPSRADAALRARGRPGGRGPRGDRAVWIPIRASPAAAPTCCAGRHRGRGRRRGRGGGAAEPRLAHGDAAGAAARHAEGGGDARRQARRCPTAPPSGSPASRRASSAHRMRAETDAVVVGVTTALRDDPALTVRLPEPWPREPYRVVLDTQRPPRPDRTPDRCRHAGPRTHRGRRGGARRRGWRRWRPPAPACVRCPTRDGRIDAAALLERLFALEVRAVLVEGGRRGARRVRRRRSGRPRGACSWRRCCSAAGRPPA